MRLRGRLLILLVPAFVLCGSWNRDNPCDPNGKNYHSLHAKAMNDTTVAVNDSFYIHAAGIDTNGKIKEFLWALDGVSYKDSTDSGRIKTAFASNGVKTVKVEVLDVDGVVSQPDSFVVTVLSAGAPAITTQPKSDAVTAGQSVTFSVVATGTAPLTYQWSLNGAAISGATSSSYTIPNVQAANAGTYTVTVSNGTFPNATSSGAVLTVNAVSGTVTDIDGNVYHTITIGTQVWMVENLKTTKYNDGTAIPLVTGNAAWAALTTPGYCWYNDTATYGNTYGALYNWYTVNTGKLAPTGWHVARDSEWSVLTTYLGGESVAGGKLKEAGTAHWLSPNTGATNETGFTALPGGVRDDKGTFSHIGSYGFWWSSTARDAASAWARFMGWNYADVSHSDNGSTDYASGYSVRCVKDNTPPVAPSITTPPQTQTVTAGQSVTFSVTATGTAPLSYQWYKDGTAISGATSASYSIANVQAANAGTYTVTASNGTLPNATSAGAVLTVSAATGGTVTDTDGNVYQTVTIGTQVWMVEDLKTTHYNDGSAIPLVTDNTAWDNLTTPGYCYYNNDINNKDKYGALYNWFVIDPSNLKKIAPTGWHVPSDSEWTVLDNYLISNGYNWDATTTGEKTAKSLAAQSDWSASTNAGAIGNDLTKNNRSGFSALPGGCRSTYGGHGFFYVGSNNAWWSSTAVDASSAWGRGLAYDGDSLRRLSVGANKSCGYSVRLVRDNNTIPPSAPVISSAAAGDSSVTVSWNTVTGATSYNLYYAAGATVTMTSGTKLAGVTSSKQITGLTDGTQYAFAVTAVNTAGQESVLSNVMTTTPQATSGTVTDIDGNVYHTVTIGTQVWMVENLKTTRYNDGTAIPLVTDNTAWAALTTPGYCWYNNSAIYGDTFGALYNWYVVNTGKLAPTGWHVATDAEWTTLTTYLGGTDVAGGKLKEAGLAHWLSPNTGATNETGFTALPCGGRDSKDGTFTSIGVYDNWWSSTAYNATLSWSTFVYNIDALLYRFNSDNNADGFSVRCVRDP
jgi:uncharacterized protein (TIGR02145 family)